MIRRAPLDTRVRRLAAATVWAGAVAVAPTLGAQALAERSALLAPQVVTYRFDTPDDRRITQLAVPIAFAMPVGERLSIDLATAYTSVRLEATGMSSAIDGLTDTQLRASYGFGTDNVVLTAGVNLPTGQSTVNLEREGAAAGQIGNDFLAFPISNMGTGFAGTGGIAVARTAGAWNVGAGASFRRAVAYDAFTSTAIGTVRFQPGDEYRLRLGADRALGDGAVTVGATYIAFGPDADGFTTYSSGDRVLAQGGWSRPIGKATLRVSAWDLYRMSGQSVVDTAAPAENIANLAVAAGFRVGRQTIEPNVELRRWTRDGATAGTLGLLGVRGRVGRGRLSASPSIALATGTLSPEGVASLGIGGWRAGVTVEVR